jgi:hypothetical protein
VQLLDVTKQLNGTDDAAPSHLHCGCSKLGASHAVAAHQAVQVLHINMLLKRTGTLAP